MTVPYTPVQFAAPIISPLLAPAGPLPIPLLSISDYRSFPTAMDGTDIAVKVKRTSPGPAEALTVRAVINPVRRDAERLCAGLPPMNCGGRS